MPRNLVRASGHARERSLGWLALEWLEFFVVHGPGDVQGDPVTHRDEYTGFIADCYAVDENGRMFYDSAFLSRPKGCDKSGMGGRFGLFEALGPSRFDGFAEGGEVYQDPWGLGFTYEYQPGEPMGRPVRVPFIRCMATEEEQTGLVYDTIYFNLTEGRLQHVPGLNTGLTRTLLPGGGEITPSTASSAAKDGGKETFTVFDEPMALDTVIPTPTGWRRIGDLVAGDYVFGVNGEPILVWGVAPIKHNRPCYRVTFDDGTSVVTDANHRWTVYDRISTKRWGEWSTAQMAAANWYGKLRFSVAQPGALKIDERSLPLDPYVLGLWLGDGDERAATLAVGRDDLNAVLAELADLGFTTSVYDYSQDKCPIVRFNHGQRYGKSGTSQHALRELGMLENKHVPEEYLWASRDQRLALLQGLMDSDGYVNERGNCTFTSSSRALSDAVVHLVRSLGWRVTAGQWASDDRWNNRAGSWRVSFTPSGAVPFRLKRKAARCRPVAAEKTRAIRGIEPVESVPVRCIAVDSEDHLFLTGDGMLPTHNTHLYNQPELKRMYRTVARNLRKRKGTAGTWYLETTTMFAPGQESVAEETFRLAERIKAGKAKRERLLYDHRWGECEDPSDEPTLRKAIVEAYGDAMEWQDLDGLVDEFFDPRATIHDSRRFFLNAETETSDAWLAPREWDPAAKPLEVITDDELVTLGFDGSVRDDATALVMCRVSDGHLQIPEHAGELTCWEKPDDARPDWQIDREAVDAAVAAIMNRYQVVGFYADPAHWQDYLDRWHNEYAERMQARATQARPLEYWTNRTRVMVSALERFHEAVTGKSLSHDGGHVLRRHVLNARRRITRSGLTIGKEHPGSPNKIDACMAAVLAYEARADAVAAGAATPPPQRSKRLHRF